MEKTKKSVNFEGHPQYTNKTSFDYSSVKTTQETNIGQVVKTSQKLQQEINSTLHDYVSLNQRIRSEIKEFLELQ